MSAKSKRRMTAVEFEALRPYLTSISVDRLNAAKACMVDGRTMPSVAADYNWTRQSVNECIGIVWKAFERYHESQKTTANAGTLLPPGWEQVMLIAPSHLIAKFRAEIAEASTEKFATEPKIDKK